MKLLIHRHGEPGPISIGGRVISVQWSQSSAGGAGSIVGTIASSSADSSEDDLCPQVGDWVSVHKGGRARQLCVVVVADHVNLSVNQGSGAISAAPHSFVAEDWLTYVRRHFVRLLADGSSVGAGTILGVDEWFKSVGNGVLVDVSAPNGVIGQLEKMCVVLLRQRLPESLGGKALGDSITYVGGKDGGAACSSYPAEPVLGQRIDAVAQFAQSYSGGNVASIIIGTFAVNSEIVEMFTALGPIATGTPQKPIDAALGSSLLFVLRKKPVRSAEYKVRGRGKVIDLVPQDTTSEVTFDTSVRIRQGQLVSLSTSRAEDDRNNVVTAYPSVITDLFAWRSRAKGLPIIPSKEEVDRHGSQVFVTKWPFMRSDSTDLVTANVVRDTAHFMVGMHEKGRGVVVVKGGSGIEPGRGFSVSIGGREYEGYIDSVSTSISVSQDDGAISEASRLQVSRFRRKGQPDYIPGKLPAYVKPIAVERRIESGGTEARRASQATKYVLQVNDWRDITDLAGAARTFDFIAVRRRVVRPIEDARQWQRNAELHGIKTIWWSPMFEDSDPVAEGSIIAKMSAITRSSTAMCNAEKLWLRESPNSDIVRWTNRASNTVEEYSIGGITVGRHRAADFIYQGYFDPRVYASKEGIQQTTADRFNVIAPMCYGVDRATVARKVLRAVNARRSSVNAQRIWSRVPKFGLTVGVGRKDKEGKQWGFWNDSESQSDPNYIATPGMKTLVCAYRPDYLFFYMGDGASGRLTSRDSDTGEPSILTMVDEIKTLHRSGGVEQACLVTVDEWRAG